MVAIVIWASKWHLRNMHFNISIPCVVSRDPLSPTYIPSIFKHVSSPQKEKLKKLYRHSIEDNCQKRRKNIWLIANEALVKLQQQKEMQVTNLEPSPCNISIESHSNSTGSQTDISMINCSAVVADNMSLRAENLLLKDKLKDFSLDEDILLDNNKVKCITGLESRKTLRILYE